MKWTNYTKQKHQCLIDGERIEYDVCGSTTLEDAKKYYGDTFVYIGSSNTYFINGTKNVSKTPIHFFVYADK